jgi:Domain of unknown function (DUF4169)
MGDTVNLRQWKKRRERSEAEVVAAQNRVTYGMPKALKQELKAESDAAAMRLDGRKLEPKRPS